MRKIVLTIAGVVLFVLTSFAQTREELEKQRKQYKEEMDQLQRQYNEIQGKTKLSLNEYIIANKKLGIQEKVVDNISRDISLIDNSIYKNQREINKLNLILDTLRNEYAKSMVYAYKNRNNYDFLSFVFSAESFNDAIKRIAYLKSYRTYRELQGENILRTQALLKQRIDEQNGNKQIKSDVLEVKSSEMEQLAKQEEEKKQIVAKYKAQGKEIGTKLAAIKKRYQKVSSAIALVVKKAQEAAIAEAKRAEAERIRNEKKPVTNPSNPVVKTEKPVKKTEAPVSVLITNENRALNEKFEINRGGLPWPIDKGYVLMHYGSNELPDGGTLINPGVTFGTDIGASVKAIFNGVVSKVVYIDNMQVVILQHGKYFTSYSNLSSVSVQPGQSVSTGQVLGKAGVNDDGIGSVDLLLSSEKGQDNPERWIHK